MKRPIFKKATVAFDEELLGIKQQLMDEYISENNESKKL